MNLMVCLVCSLLLLCYYGQSKPNKTNIIITMLYHLFPSFSSTGFIIIQCISFWYPVGAPRLPRMLHQLVVSPAPQFRIVINLYYIAVFNDYFNDFAHRHLDLTVIIYIFYLIQKKELVSDVNRKEVKREAKLEGMRVAMKVRVPFKIYNRVIIVTLLLIYT